MRTNDGNQLRAPLGVEMAAPKSNGEFEVRRMDDTSKQELIPNDYVAHFSIAEKMIIFVAWILTIICPALWFCTFKTVKEYERALIFRLGKLVGNAAGPGLFAVNPLLDMIRIVDMRVITFDLHPQDMMTKDSVTVTVDAVVFMKVMDPIRAILEIDSYHEAFVQFSATTLRSVVGTYELEQILGERDNVNESIRTIIEQETTQWGVCVPSIEIKDVKLPQNMQRAMAAEAEAERERRAKIISASGEAEAAVKLAQAATIIGSCPGALQLRYLHTLVKISAEKNSTILFPLPMELMRGVQMFTENIEMQMKMQMDQVQPHEDLV